MTATAATIAILSSRSAARRSERSRVVDRQSVRLHEFIGIVTAAALTIALLLVPGTHASAFQAQLAALLVVMACVAMQFPLQVTPKIKVNTSSAVYFTAVLVLAPGTAVVVAGVSQLAGGLILVRRRNPLTGRPRRRLLDTIFNASQWMIATSGSGVVLNWLAGSGDSGSTLLWFSALVAAAIAMYLVNTVLVAIVAAIQTKQPLVTTWIAGRRVDAITEAGLYTISAVASAAVPSHPWVLLGLVVPTILLHNSLQRTLQLHRQTVAALEQMADLVDVRDGYTGQHSARVADYAQQIARALRLNSDETATIRLAARVHDIGKIAIPDRILHKPGRLDPTEWELMKSHVAAGCQVLERFDDYAHGVELVRCHHERIDGSGYPRGLREKQIPLGAQIVGISDAIDAMTSDRPYRHAMPLTAVRDELVRAAGTQFGSAVVEAAVRVLDVAPVSVTVGSLRQTAAAV
jgi:HD-GYP domain-containing protein (c-di-GMP phosphodiesterase class II)